jgi:hypothetical protein
VIASNGPFAEGFSVSGSNVTIDSSSARGVTSSLGYPEGAGLTIGVPGLTNPEAPSNIVVTNSTFNSNSGPGIYSGSTQPLIQPSKLRFDNVTVDGNGAYGIHIERGATVAIGAPLVTGNAAGGLILGSTGLPSSDWNQVQGITLTDANVSGNSGAGTFPQILIAGGSGTTIQGGTVTAHGNPGQPALETFATVFNCGSCIATPTPPQDLTLSNIAVNADSLADAFSFNGAPAESGQFNLSFAGSPEGVLAAPPGSVYVDATTLQQWTKASGITATGWTSP